MNTLEQYKQQNTLIQDLYVKFDEPWVVLLKEHDPWTSIVMDNEDVWHTVAYLGIEPMWLCMEAEELTRFVLMYADAYLYYQKLDLFEEELNWDMEIETDVYDWHMTDEWTPFHSCGTKMRNRHRFKLAPGKWIKVLSGP